MENKKCNTPLNKNEEKCEDWKPFEFSALQIATYAINCPREDRYFEEVTHMIERYADTRIWQELELPQQKKCVKHEHYRIGDTLLCRNCSDRLE